MYEQMSEGVVALSQAQRPGVLRRFVFSLKTNPYAAAVGNRALTLLSRKRSKISCVALERFMV